MTQSEIVRDASGKIIKLPKYTLERITVNGIRRYRTPAGQAWPGSTSVLSATKSTADEKALLEWRKRIGEENADNYTADACARGTLVHEAIERYLEGDRTSVDPETETFGYWRSIAPIVESVTPVLIEGAIWHSSGYAGTLDCLAYHEGCLKLMDWKTSAAPKPEERVQDYFLQAAAYSRAANELYGLDIQDAIIAIAIPWQPAQLYVLDKDALDAYFQLWQYRLAKFKILHGLSVESFDNHIVSVTAQGSLT